MKKDFLTQANLLDMTTVAATMNFDGRKVDAERSQMRGEIIDIMLAFLTNEEVALVKSQARQVIERRVRFSLAAGAAE